MKTEQETKKEMEKKFVFAFFEEGKLFLEKEKVGVADIARLVLLSTYLNYEGRIMVTQRKPMSKEELKKITRCTRYSTWMKFWETVTKANILEIAPEGDLYMNPKYFKKGSVKEKQENMSHIRLYTEEIRQIFESSESRDVISLGHYFSLIPFVNFRYNVISHKPSEHSRRKLEPMCIDEVCKTLNMSMRGLEKTITSLSKFKTADDSLILRTFKTFGDKRKNKIIINPYVMYRGNWADQDIEVIMEIYEQMKEI